MSKAQDKAGKEYWDKNWESPLPKLIDPTRRAVSNEINRRFHRFFSDEVSDIKKEGKRLLEIGCARSIWLPYFSLHHGFSVTGLDYSEEGCRQEVEMLRMAGVGGDVVCADMFHPPEHMKGKFDVVVSVGVVEHFTDTGGTIKALGEYLRPGGKMITVVPNMCGSVGVIQKLCDRKVFDIHVPLNPLQLRKAHDMANLRCSKSAYLMSCNYYVVNASHRRGVLRWPVRIFSAILGRISMAVWLLERVIGERRATKLFSPYVICVAQKL